MKVTGRVIGIRKMKREELPPKLTLNFVLLFIKRGRG